jgi:hypothetical protein
MKFIVLPRLAACSLVGFLAFTGAAFSQAAVSIYGGYTNIDAPSVAGHAANMVLGKGQQQWLNIRDAGFFGVSVRSPELNGLFSSFELYAEGQKGKKDDRLNTSGHNQIISIDGGGYIVDTGTASSVLDRYRYEFGLRGKLATPGMMAFTLTPFFGFARENVRTSFLSTSYGFDYKRGGSLDWQYAGAELGIQRTQNLRDNLDLVGTLAAGAYGVFAKGDFHDNWSSLPPSIDASESRAGFRGSAKLELKSQWSQTVSSSLFAQATYWSTTPYVALPHVPGGPAAHIGFDDMTEFRVGLMLTVAAAK